MASKKIHATEKISLGDASTQSVGRIVFKIRDDSSLSTSMVVKARILGEADAELVSVPYTDRSSNTALAAGTAITAAGLYEVDATGVEIVLDNTYTSGSGTVVYQPVVG